MTSLSEGRGFDGAKEPVAAEAAFLRRNLWRLLQHLAGPRRRSMQQRAGPR